MDILAATPKRHPDIAWRAIVDEGLLVNPHTSKVYPLNQLALRIWQESDGTKTTAHIIDLLLEEFDAPREVMAQDVVEFIQSLQTDNLILVPA